MNGLKTIPGQRRELRTRSGSPLVAWLFFLHTLLLLAVSLPAHSSAGSILVVSSGKATVYSEVVSALRDNLAGRCDTAYSCPATEYRIDYRNNGETLSIPPGTDLVITLGAKAAQSQVILDTAIPVVHALVSQASSGKFVHGRKHLTLFLDQPIARQLKLAIT